MSEERSDETKRLPLHRRPRTLSEERSDETKRLPLHRRPRTLSEERSDETKRRTLQRRPRTLSEERSDETKRRTLQRRKTQRPSASTVGQAARMRYGTGWKTASIAVISPPTTLNASSIAYVCGR